MKTKERQLPIGFLLMETISLLSLMGPSPQVPLQLFLPTIQVRNHRLQTSNLSLGWNQDGGFFAENIVGGNSKLLGSLNTQGTIELAIDPRPWPDNFYSRVWLMDTSRGSRFDTIGSNKPQSF